MCKQFHWLDFGLRSFRTAVHARLLNCTACDSHNHYTGPSPNFAKIVTFSQFPKEFAQMDRYFLLQSLVLEGEINKPYAKEILGI